MITKAKPTLEGFHTATPYLSIRNAAKAIQFYEKAFGAKELTRLAQPDGRIRHAEIKIGDASIMIADEFLGRPELGGLRSPQSLGGTSVLVHVYVEDVDALSNQAVSAGAKALSPVEDQFYGDRRVRLADPFGHVWMFATRKEDVSSDEMRKRYEALMKQQR